MHSDSLMQITNFRNNNIARIQGKKVLDVGSQDINGSYRSRFTEIGCEYIGTDIVAGNNVDVLCTFERLPFGDNSFDVVVSGQCLEHAEHPWILTKEMARVLKHRGIFFWIAPWKFQVHKSPECPFDRWRILEDGMRTLAVDAGLTVIDCQMYADDTYIIGEKKDERADKA